MKLPNLRLHETQATSSMVLGVLGWLTLFVLAFLVLRNYNPDTHTILYNDRSSLGRYRRGLVFVFAGLTLFAGGIAIGLGFNSLGQKRNNRQGRSWMGMMMGAVSVALSPVLFTTWRLLSEAVIQSEK